MTLARFTAEKLSKDHVKQLVDTVLEDFSGISGLKTIILFGSAAEGEMSTSSDIDVVLVFDTKEHMNKARELIPELRKKSIWPMDLLCVDTETFQRKSAIGGIYFVARNEGKVIFGQMP